MKKIDNTEIDISLNGFPNEIVTLMTGLLDDKTYILKHDARNTLVNKGKMIIPQMHKLLASKNDLIRKNAAKVVELIADRRSIPLFINLLYDKESDIRWIAAEGLIKIGRGSILPLLKSIRDGKSSHFHNKGAHHVLNSLLHETEKEKLAPLLLSLNNYHELGETAPVEASKALKTRARYSIA
jgi:HEAT repeats